MEWKKEVVDEKEKCRYKKRDEMMECNDDHPCICIDFCHALYL